MREGGHGAAGAFLFQVGVDFIDAVKIGSLGSAPYGQGVEADIEMGGCFADTKVLTGNGGTGVWIGAMNEGFSLVVHGVDRIDGRLHADGGH